MRTHTHTHTHAHTHTHTHTHRHTHNTYMHMHMYMHMHVYRSNTCRQTGAVGTILHVVRTGANIHVNIQGSYDSKYQLCTAWSSYLYFYYLIIYTGRFFKSPPVVVMSDASCSWEYAWNLKTHTHHTQPQEIIEEGTVIHIVLKACDIMIPIQSKS